LTPTATTTRMPADCYIYLPVARSPLLGNTSASRSYLE
jgi:hypothetical protein